MSRSKPTKLMALLLCLLFLAPISSSPSKAGSHGAEVLRDNVIVSLGDSYSSGEGIEPFYGQELGDLKYTNADWLAHRSKKSWGGRLTLPGVSGSMASLRGKNWFFAAVSGAKTENLKKCSQKRETDFAAPYLTPQFDVFNELGDLEADYITITIGGNDIGFASIVKEAAMGSTYLCTSNLSNDLNTAWEQFNKDGGTRDDIKEAYEDIEAAAGKQAHIIVAGYPELFDRSGAGALISKEEANLIDDNVRKFNQELHKIVKECSASGMRISFVSVAEAFEGHAAYSRDNYINPIWLKPRAEDLKQFTIGSSYSVHPNDKGAQAYADCVQAEINRLEKERVNQGAAFYGDSSIVLCLDVSGSMEGSAMEQTKIAARGFVETALEGNCGIGLVTFTGYSDLICNICQNSNRLNRGIDGLYPIWEGTNTEAGLEKSAALLAQSPAEKKIIVLMSDGDSNHGLTDSALIEYANSIRSTGVKIYSVGLCSSQYFTSYTQSIMRSIADPGCYYNITSVDDLTAFFGDIADSINGQRYICIRVACPVDVTVTYKGETLCSSDDDLCTRTSFGTIAFEQNEDEEQDESGEEVDDRVKVIRLKEGADYDIVINGTGKGTMDYSISYEDKDGNYSDIRDFTDIKITKSTVIKTNTAKRSATVLKVDSDGNGRFETVYRAKADSVGKLVNRSWIVWVSAAAAALAAIAAAAFILNRKKRSGLSPAPAGPAAQSSAGRQTVSPAPKSSEKRFCPNCGAPVDKKARFCGSCGKPTGN